MHQPTTTWWETKILSYVPGNVLCMYVLFDNMWQAHLETANYSRSEVLLRKPLKIADIFPFTIELP